MNSRPTTHRTRRWWLAVAIVGVVALFGCPTHAVAASTATTAATPTPEGQCVDSGGQWSDGVSFWRCSWTTRLAVPEQRALSITEPVCTTGTVTVTAADDRRSAVTSADCYYASHDLAAQACGSTTYHLFFATNQSSWECALKAEFPGSGLRVALAASCADRAGAYSEGALTPGPGYYYLCQAAPST